MSLHQSQVQVPGCSEAVETTTISHLHDEILILIMTCNAFRLYQPISKRTLQWSGIDRLPSHLQDTINASQVCHRWRIIALSSPELWNHMIDMGHPRSEWTKLLLDRSEPLGITFLNSFYDTTVDNPFRAELSLNTRIDGYLLSIPYQRVVQCTHQALSSYFKSGEVFPRLQSLNTHHYSDQYGWTFKSRLLREIFPPHTIPNLRHLYVKMMSIHYPGLKSLKQLTTLHIHLDPFHDYLAEVNSFLDILTDLHSLKDLSLINAFKKPISNEFHSRHITLPLEKLVLHDRNTTFVQVIQSMTFRNPNLQYCELGVWGEEDLDITNYQYFEQLLPSFFQSATTPTKNNRFVFMRKGFGIPSNKSVPPPTRSFYFYFPATDYPLCHCYGYYFALNKTYSDIMHKTILALPKTICFPIDTIEFSALPCHFPVNNCRGCMDWLADCLKTVLREKFSHIRHLLGVPLAWVRLVHTALLGLETHDPYRERIESYLRDEVEDTDTNFDGMTAYRDCEEVTSITLDLDFSEIKSNWNERTGCGDEEDMLDNYGTSSTREEEEEATNNSSTIGLDKFNTNSDVDKDENSNFDSDSEVSETWTTSYLCRPIDFINDTETHNTIDPGQSSDTGSVYDPDLDSDGYSLSSGSDFELELTLYEELVGICKEFRLTVKKVKGVPREDVSLESCFEHLNLFEARSMDYLEEELRVVGVEVEFCLASI